MALFAEEQSDNFGLPFWIGKVVAVCESEGEESSNDDDDDDDDGDTSGIRVKVAEWIQEQNGGRGTGKYIPYVLITGPKTKKKGAKARTEQQHTMVDLGQVCWVFDALTQGKNIKAIDKNHIAFNCEVAWKVGTYECVGVEAWNTACGYKTVPLHK